MEICLWLGQYLWHLQSFKGAVINCQTIALDQIPLKPKTGWNISHLIWLHVYTFLLRISSEFLNFQSEKKKRKERKEIDCLSTNQNVMTLKLNEIVCMFVTWRESISFNSKRAFSLLCVLEKKRNFIISSQLPFLTIKKVQIYFST